MEKTLYQQIREKHQPKQGDIYMQLNLPETMCLIRLEKKLKGQQWKAKSYSFADEDFTVEHADIATERLKAPEYQLLIHQLQKILNMADQLYCGTAPEKIEPVEPLDESITNAKELTIYKDKTDCNIDAWNTVRFILEDNLLDIQKHIEQKINLIDKYTSMLLLITTYFSISDHLE